MKLRDIHSASRRGLWALLIAVVLMRLTSLGAYPLTDTTEARYGEIARLMKETGDWITPRISQDVPFWGKPPLSFWFSAASMKFFGVNEFAARLPSWLLGIMVSAMVWQLAVRQINRGYALTTTLVLNTAIVFWISSGAVMTDPTLLVGVTVCMIAFWRAMKFKETSGRLWGYVFFAGLLIGLLAKGPVALVLTGLPVGGWTLLRWKWREVWQRLPWISGVILTAALSVPWHWMAEVKTPGFLEYFLIGEHWKRFLVPNWDGDLYGSAHLQPRGMIWLYWLACVLPWSIMAPLIFLRKQYRKSVFILFSRPDDWTLYLILWTVAPIIFFTLARNILPAYVLPGIPAFALLLAKLFQLRQEDRPVPTAWCLLWTASAMLLVFTLALTIVSLGYGVSVRSQKELVTAFQESRRDKNSQLVYLFKRPCSAQFYSDGMAGVAATTGEADSFSGNGAIDYFAVRASLLERIPPSFLDRVSVLGLINRYYLLREQIP